ncbi:MAG TPA: phosphatase PAP2 family protein [Flavisolibacter sp.]
MKCLCVLFVALFISSLQLAAQTDSTGRRLDIPVTVDLQRAVVDSPGITLQKADLQVYKLKPAVDIPLTAIGTAWSLYAFTKIYDKDSSTAAEILALNRNDLASYNRWGTNHYNPEAFTSSNYFFYGSMPLPFLFLLDGKVRKDFGKIMFLYLEAMSITGLLYTGSVYFHDKYRPYTYNPDVPMSKRTRGGGRNSFFAGHVALVATSTFYMAKVYADYHPNSSLKWLPYTIASISTGATAYLRGRAGEHFLSDIIIGTVQGTLTGLLVPHFHKNPLIKNENVSLVPYYGREKGLSLVYKF